MRFFLKPFLLFFLFLSYSSLHAQEEFTLLDNVPKIVPPSQNSISLGKYGESTSASNFSGAANASIPVYTIKGKRLSVPIALTYNTTGFKVDELSSWVGHGWALQAGGVITRVVHDKPDELHTSDTNPYRFHDVPTVLTPGLANFVIAESEAYDLQPDVFNFNFLNFSGKFFFPTNGNTSTVLYGSTIPYSNLDIKYDISSGVFTITDASGIVYVFSESEETRHEAEPNKTFEHFAKTSWFLTSITHPDGEIISFSYESTSYQYKTGVSQTLTAGCNTFQGCANSGLTNRLSVSLLYVLNGKFLKSISSQNETVSFLSTDDWPRAAIGNKKLNSIEVRYNNVLKKEFGLTYIKTGNSTLGDLSYRLFLESLTESDASGNKLNSHKFFYSDLTSLPDRLSFSQDYWGYANGKLNSDFVSKSDDYTEYFGKYGGNREPDEVAPLNGLLTKIEYPTGGSEIIEYEPNYVNEDYLYHSYATQSASIQGSGLFNTESTKLSFTPYGTKYTIKYGLTISDLDNYDQIHQVGAIEIKDISSKSYFSQTFKNTPTEILSTIILSTTLPGALEITLKANGLNATSWCSVTYENAPPETRNHNIQKGGARVKKRTISSGNGQPDQIFKYYYNAFKQRNIPTGIANQKYIDISTNKIIYGIMNDECNYISKYSSSQYLINVMGISHIVYPNVTIGYGENFENGGIEYNYDYSGIYGSKILFGEEIPYSPKDNTSEWKNGQLLSEKKFKVLTGSGTNELTPVKTQETYYTYKESSFNLDEAKGLTVRKKYTPFFGWTRSETCSGNNSDYETYGCNKNHHHSWYSSSLFNGWRCLNGNNVVVSTLPCWGKSGTEVITNADGLDNYDIASYTLSTRWQYNDTKRVVTYDENGNNPVTTTETNKYNNSLYPLLSEKEFIGSSNVKYKTKYKYIFDYQNSNSIVSDFLNKHNWALIENQKWTDLKLTSSYVIDYNLSGLPKKLYKLETNQPLSINDYIETMDAQNKYTSFIPNSYLKQKENIDYDANTNIIQHNKINDISNSIIWAYSSALPVIEASNVDYTTLSNAVSTALTSLGYTLANIDLFYTSIGLLDDLGSRNKYKSFISALRSNTAMENVILKAYTYNPLVGMTSSTDPNGLTTYYDYDGFGRLKNVRDKDQNILNRSYYHYYSETSSDQALLSISTALVSFAATVYSSSFAITANCPWTVASSSTWLTVSPLSGSLNGNVTVNATVNTGAARSAIVTVTYGSGLIKTITFSQAAGNLSTLSVDQTSLQFLLVANLKYVNVSSNTSWTVTKSETWITLTVTSGSGNGTVGISATKLTSTSATRSGYVTLTTSDGRVSIQIDIIQSGSSI